MTETLYIVDIATYGNIIKLFLSKTKNKDIWGDDQNDAPYEHNAGEVYDKFVDATYSIVIDPKYYVTTPEFDYTYGGNSPFCKDDFKKRNTPAVIVGELDDWDFLYSQEVEKDTNAKLFYYDTLKSTIKNLSPYILKDEIEYTRYGACTGAHTLSMKGVQK